MSQYDYKSDGECRRNLEFDFQYRHSEESVSKFGDNEVQFIPVEIHDENPCSKYSGNLSQPGCERYYSRAELRTIDKFNSLFNKIVVLPSCTYCGSSFSDGNSGSASTRKNFSKISDEEITQDEHDSNLINPYVEEAGHYSCKHQRPPRKKFTNRLKLVKQNRYRHSQEKLSKAIPYKDRKTNNHRREYTSLLRFIFEKILLHCDKSDLVKIKRNILESKEFDSSIEKHCSLLWDSLNSFSDHDDNKTDNSSEIKQSTFKNKDPRHTHKKISPISQDKHFVTQQKLVQINKYEKNCVSYRSKYKMEAEKTLGLRNTPNLNCPKLFQNNLCKRPEECQLLVKHMPFKKTSLNKNDRNMNLFYSIVDPPLTSSIIETNQTLPKLSAESDRGEETPVKAREDLVSLLNEMKKAITKYLLQRKPIEGVPSACENIKHALREFEEREKTSEVATLNSEDEPVGQNNIANEMINEEKKRERQKKIQNLIKDIVIDIGCYCRGEPSHKKKGSKEKSLIIPEALPIDRSEKGSLHLDIHNKQRREKKINDLIEMISMKRNSCVAKTHIDNRETNSVSYIPNVNENEEKNEQYDRKKEIEMKMGQLMKKLNLKSSCSCENIRNEIINDYELISEYTSAELCEFDTIRSGEKLPNETEDLIPTRVDDSLEEETRKRKPFQPKDLTKSDSDASTDKNNASRDILDIISSDTLLHGDSEITSQKTERDLTDESQSFEIRQDLKFRTFRDGDEFSITQTTADKQNNTEKIDEIETGTSQIIDKREESDRSKVPVGGLIVKNANRPTSFDIQKKTHSDIQRETGLNETTGRTKLSDERVDMMKKYKRSVKDIITKSKVEHKGPKDIEGESKIKRKRPEDKEIDILTTKRKISREQLEITKHYKKEPTVNKKESIKKNFDKSTKGQSQSLNPPKLLHSSQRRDKKNSNQTEFDVVRYNVEKEPKKYKPKGRNRASLSDDDKAATNGSKPISRRVVKGQKINQIRNTTEKTELNRKKHEGKRNESKFGNLKTKELGAVPKMQRKYEISANESTEQPEILEQDAYTVQVLDESGKKYLKQTRDSLRKSSEITGSESEKQKNDLEFIFRKDDLKKKYDKRRTSSGSNVGNGVRKTKTRNQRKHPDIPEMYEHAAGFTDDKSVMTKVTVFDDHQVLDRSDHEYLNVDSVSDTSTEESPYVRSVGQDSIPRKIHLKKKQNLKEEGKRKTGHSKAKNELKKGTSRKFDEGKFNILKKDDSSILPEDKMIHDKFVECPDSCSFKTSREHNINKNHNKTIKIELKSEYLDILEDVALAKALEMEEILKISIGPRTKAGISISDQSKGEYSCKSKMLHDSLGKTLKWNKNSCASKFLESELEWSPSSLVNINILVDDGKKQSCNCQKKIPTPSHSDQNFYSLSNVNCQNTNNTGSKVKNSFFSACKKTCNKIKCNCLNPSNFYCKSTSNENSRQFSQHFPSREEIPLVVLEEIPVPDSSGNYSSHNRDSRRLCGKHNNTQTSNVYPSHLSYRNETPNKILENETNETQMRKRISLKSECICDKCVKFRCPDSNDSQKSKAVSTNLDEKKAHSKWVKNFWLHQCLGYFDSQTANSPFKNCVIFEHLSENFRIDRPLSNKEEIICTQSKSEKTVVGQCNGILTQISQIFQDGYDKYQTTKKWNTTDLTCLDDKLCRKLGSQDLTGNFRRTSFALNLIPYRVSEENNLTNTSQEFEEEKNEIYSYDKINSEESRQVQRWIDEKNSPKNINKIRNETVFRIFMDNGNIPRITEKENDILRTTSTSETKISNYDTEFHNFFGTLTKSEQKFLTDSSNRYAAGQVEINECFVFDSDLSDVEYSTNDEIVEQSTSHSDGEELFLSKKGIICNQTLLNFATKSKTKCSNSEKRKKKREFLNHYEKQRSFMMRKRHKTNTKPHSTNKRHSENNTDEEVTKCEYIDLVTSGASYEKYSSAHKFRSVSSESLNFSRYKISSLDNGKGSLMSETEPIASNINNNNIYAPYRVDPALYHVALESVENENQQNIPEKKIKFRIAFFFKKSKGRIKSLLKFVYNNKRNEDAEMNEFNRDEEADRASAARTNLMKQKKILSSKLRQSDSKRSQLFITKKFFDEKNFKIQLTPSAEEMQPEPVLKEIRSCDIIDPYSENDSGGGESRDDERSDGEEDKESFALSEDSSMLFIRKEVYDRLQRYGNLRYTLYIGKRNELDHISIESIESAEEEKVQCDDRPFFASFNLGTKDVLVHVTEDKQEDDVPEAVFKDESYVECRKSNVKLSLMRGVKYLEQLDPKQANIIEIDCANRLEEIKICYKKDEPSSSCVCQSCKDIPPHPNDLSSTVIDEIDKSLNEFELCKHCEACENKSKSSENVPECTNAICYVKKNDILLIEKNIETQLVSELESMSFCGKRTDGDSDSSVECMNELCAKKIDNTSTNGDKVDVKTVQFMHVTQRGGFQSAYQESMMKSTEICPVKKLDSCGREARKNSLRFFHIPQISGFCRRRQRRKNVPSKNGSRKSPFRNENQEYPPPKRSRYRKKSSFHFDDDYKPTLILTITHFQNILDISN